MSEAAEPRVSSPWARLSRLLRGIFRWLLASGLCLSPLTSVFVVGWAQGGMQRRIHRAWGSDALDPPGGLLRRIGGCLGRGCSTTICTGLLVVPIFSLQYVSWNAGWDNSFHKQVERAAFGPLLFLASVPLLGVVMLFLPWAQARHAATGEWRSFFDLRVVPTLVRRHWLAGLMLGLLYALWSVPLHALFGLLGILGNEARFDDASDAELRRFLNNFYFAVTALLVVPGFFLLRSLAARLYARGMLRALRDGELGLAELGALERIALRDAPRATEPAPPGPLRRNARRLGWMLLAGTSVLTWAAVIAQVLISQFLVTRPAGWFNHAVILLPSIRRIPEHLGG